MALSIYEVDSKYIDYLLPYAQHLFQNKKPDQRNEQKYVGVVLELREMKYFVPLSSFKPKHKKMQNSVDFIKLGEMAVLNINNMFPVPDGLFHRVDFAAVKDFRYRKLLMKEYRIIRVTQDKIRKNAAILYDYRIKNGDTTKLGKRCNDFKLLEEKSRAYKENDNKGQLC